MSVRAVTAAVCQLPSWLDDPDRTWRGVESGVADSAAAGAELIVLPELCTTGSTFTGPQEARDRAEPVNGPTVRRLAALSKETGTVLIAGWCETAPEAPLPYNSAVVLDRGEVVQVYRKTHLWGTEKHHFTPGDRLPPVIDTGVGRLAAVICYDLEIPEVPRTLARAGAQVLAVPANWPELPTPPDQLPIEIAKAQAAAAANRIAVLIADRCGTERGVRWTGGSVLIGPDGYRLDEVVLHTPGIRVGQVFPAQADDKRLGPDNDAFGDLRPQLYEISGPGGPPPRGSVTSPGPR